MTDTSDPTDVASDREQQARDLAIANHVNRPRETPDEDENGNRFCLDCADEISKARVAAVDAVRCVDCESMHEEKRKKYRTF